MFWAGFEPKCVHNLVHQQIIRSGNWHYGIRYVMGSVLYPTPYFFFCVVVVVCLFVVVLQPSSATTTPTWSMPHSATDLWNASPLCHTYPSPPVSSFAPSWACLDSWLSWTKLKVKTEDIILYLATLKCVLGAKMVTVLEKCCNTYTPL